VVHDRRWLTGGLLANGKAGLSAQKMDSTFKKSILVPRTVASTTKTIDLIVETKVSMPEKMVSGTSTAVSGFEKMVSGTSTMVPGISTTVPGFEKIASRIEKIFSMTNTMVKIDRRWKLNVVYNLMIVSDHGL